MSRANDGNGIISSFNKRNAVVVAVCFFILAFITGYKE